MDTDEVGRVLVDLYGIDPLLVRRRTAPEADVHVYRIENRQGKQWLLRLGLANKQLPPWLSAGTLQDGFLRHAAVLAWCRRREFPAPRVRRTLEKQSVMRWEGWVGLLVSFLPGEVLTPTPWALAQLGSQLGRLHNCELNDALPDSWWYPLESAARRALAVLESIEDVPDEWLDLQQKCREALLAYPRLANLPVSCIHGDSYHKNALVTSEGQLALIDWEYAGLGPAVLDLGTLLEDCYIAGADLPRVDQESFSAALEGYQRERRLEPAELAAVGTAICFGAAHRCAVRFSYAEESGWSDLVLNGLRREQERMIASKEIAAGAGGIRHPGGDCV